MPKSTLEVVGKATTCKGERSAVGRSVTTGLTSLCVVPPPPPLLPVVRSVTTELTSFCVVPPPPFHKQMWGPYARLMGLSPAEISPSTSLKIS